MAAVSVKRPQQVDVGDRIYLKRTTYRILGFSEADDLLLSSLAGTVVRWWLTSDAVVQWDGEARRWFATDPPMPPSNLSGLPAARMGRICPWCWQRCTIQGTCPLLVGTSPFGNREKMLELAADCVHKGARVPKDYGHGRPAFA